MSKMLISYINTWAAGTVTASSEHPSFPATNTQHRWYKKPWRSKYGVGSGGGTFRITAANNSIHFGEVKTTDGRLETWASATNLTNWSELIAGTSTVNREATTVKYGSYSARFDVDASESNAGIYQTVTLVAGAAHRVSFWHNTPVGSSISFQVKDSAGNQYLQADGSWNAAATWLFSNGTGAWAFHYLDFNAHASYMDYVITVVRGENMASLSQYVDDISIAQRFTATLTTGDYDAATLAVEIGTQMDAAGTLTYTVTYSESTYKFTFAATGYHVLFTSISTSCDWRIFGFAYVAYDQRIATSRTSALPTIHTEEFLFCDAGATSTLRFLAIKNHNLQSSAKISIRYYSDAFLTEVDHEDLTWSAGQIAVRISESYEYFAVRISDMTNPVGYVEVGLVWAGDAAQLHYGFTPDRGRVPEDPSVISASEDGQESSIQLSRYADRTYAFDAIEPNTDYDYLEAVFQEIGKSRPCFIVEAPPVLGDVSDSAQYVKIVEWEWSHLAGGYWSLEIATRSKR